MKRKAFTGFLAKLEQKVTLPDDTKGLRIHKVTLSLAAILIGIAGIVWGFQYLLLGFHFWVYFWPFFYSVSVGFGFALFLRFKNYQYFLAFQLFMILMVPMVLQWTLGGFDSSGAVILWSFLSPLGAVLFLEGKRALVWYLAFALAIVLSIFLEFDYLKGIPHPSHGVIIFFFAMNIIAVSFTVFYTLSYYVREVQGKDYLEELVEERTRKLLEANDQLQLEISERKRTERELNEAKLEAEKANQTKSNFLATMSHEIRTPMNGVIGMTHLALKTELSRKQRDYLQKIESSAHALLGIIDDILDVSKIEAGKLQLDSSKFQLDDVLHTVFNVVNPHVQDKNLELLFHPVPLDYTLVGDPLRLGQILINLTNNAIKFTQNGEIHIRVEILKQEQEKIHLQFSVADEGIGMKSEHVAKLFQPFTQADGSISRKYGGTGLGLAICKHLTELMGGKIWVESVENQGSTFYFTCELGIKSPVRDKLSNLPSAVQDLSVLVVDDNASARDILTAMLDSFRIRSKAVGSGDEAIAEVKRVGSVAPYRLILVDWQMQGKDGFETIEALRRIDTTNDLKFIMVTAYGREEIRSKAEKIGVDGFLHKPVSPSLLLDSIVETVVGEEDLPDEYRKRYREVLEEYRFSFEANILLVEDNAINRQIASEMLESAGLKVTVAENGREALQILDAENPKTQRADDFQAVLMDIQMPELNGIEATKVIRKNPALKRIPIIGLTAHALEDERKRCLASGMNAHLAKPIDVMKLYRTVGQWIGEPEVVEASFAEKEKMNGVEIPSLARIEVAEGLRRVNGNKRLYLQLLERFAKEQRDIGDDVERLLCKGEFSEAKRLLHTLKGVSGNVGAKALYDLCRKLELVVKEDQDNWSTSYELFARELKQVLAELAGLPISTATPKPPTGALKADESEVKRIVTEIFKLCRNAEADAEDFTANHLGLLQGYVGEAISYELDREIRNYDFDAAIVILRRIAMKSGWSLED